MSKSDSYSSKEVVNELEILSDKLAADLRINVRSISSYRLFSEQWLNMADIFGRIATVSDMESKLSGSKSDSNATLWETEEQALRYIIEDGKLNLCLKSIAEYKEHQRQLRLEGKAFPKDIEEKCNKFERGISVVLRNAWSHIEALQTTELVGLISHISNVIVASMEAPKIIADIAVIGELHQRQEIMVFYYICCIMHQIEGIHESRIMPFLREHGIFMHSVKFALFIHDQIPETYIMKILESLSLITDTDDFKTYTIQYITNASDVEELIELKTNVIQGLLTTMDNRRILRSLLDCIDKSKRTYKLK